VSDYLDMVQRSWMREHDPATIDAKRALDEARRARDDAKASGDRQALRTASRALGKAEKTYTRALNAWRHGGVR
jgi:hypothetical protein